MLRLYSFKYDLNFEPTGYVGFFNDIFKSSFILMKTNVGGPQQFEAKFFHQDIKLKDLLINCNII